MGSRFQIQVEPGLIEQHIVAYLITTEILRAQSQPICLVGGDERGLSFDLRVNLNQQQCDRLIVREINQNLPTYEALVDWPTKTLAVVMRADKTRKRKPARSQEPTPARGDAGIDAG